MAYTAQTLVLWAILSCWTVYLLQCFGRTSCFLFQNDLVRRGEGVCQLCKKVAKVALRA